LRRQLHALKSAHRISPNPDPTMAKPSGNHIALGGFVSFEEFDIMVWLLALPITCLAVAVFMWRFERYLEQLTGPWISD
jgi:hypothetical protein